jgi:tetratricopeptide (TPR) repeat protein
MSSPLYHRRVNLFRLIQTVEKENQMKKKRDIFGWVGMILLVCFVLLSACGGMDKKGEAEKHFKIGVQYFEEHQLEEALKELRLAVKLNPEHADAHYNLGGLYHLVKAYSQAIKEYEEVLRIDPNYPRIHTAFANLYYVRGLMAWGRAVKMDRITFWLPDTTRKLPFEDKDGLVELIQEYHNRVDVDTADAETFSKLSQAYFVLAAEEYQKAVQASAVDTTAQLYLGLTYSEQGYPDKAMTQHEILKKLDPNSAELLITILQQKEKEKTQIEESPKGGI